MLYFSSTDRVGRSIVSRNCHFLLRTPPCTCGPASCVAIGTWNTLAAGLL